MLLLTLIAAIFAMSLVPPKSYWFERGLIVDSTVDLNQPAYREHPPRSWRDYLATDRFKWAAFAAIAVASGYFAIRNFRQDGSEGD
jgi:hypothetical protein